MGEERKHCVGEGWKVEGAEARHLYLYICLSVSASVSSASASASASSSEGDITSTEPFADFRNDYSSRIWLTYRKG